MCLMVVNVPTAQSNRAPLLCVAEPEDCEDFLLEILAEYPELIQDSLERLNRLEAALGGPNM